MDYEAPLMPCGCILLHRPHIPGTGSMPRTQGEGEALVASSRALTWGLGLSCCPGFQPGHSQGSWSPCSETKGRLGELPGPWGHWVLLGPRSSRPRPPGGLRLRRQHQGL